MKWFMEPKLSLHTVLFAIVFADAAQEGEWRLAAIVFAVAVATAWLWQWSRTLAARPTTPGTGEGE